MLKFLSWNIQQGGGSRLNGILRFIKQQNPQILVLSEFRNNDTGILLRQKLLALKYTFQFVSLAESNTNSVLIASQLPCQSRIFTHKNIDHNHSIIAADFEAFHLYGVYLPHKKKHQLFPLLQAEIEQHSPTLVMGDFNTGKNFIDQKGDSFWYTADLAKLEKAGMRDAFRHLHGPVEAYSWYSHQGNGFRYDHIYASVDLLPIIKKCDYVQEAREQKLSDHAPMLLEL